MSDLLLWLHNKLAAGKSLADIVIGLACEFKGNTMGRPCPKALARHAIKLHRDRVFRQSRMAIALGHFTRKHGACRAVPVADFAFNDHWRAMLQRGHGLCDERPVEDFLKSVIL